MTILLWIPCCSRYNNEPTERVIPLISWEMDNRQPHERLFTCIFTCLTGEHFGTGKLEYNNVTEVDGTKKIVISGLR